MMRRIAFFIETIPPYEEQHCWGTSEEAVIAELEKEGYKVDFIESTAGWESESGCGMPDHPPEGGY
mgnify:CR=1 FL=1